MSVLVCNISAHAHYDDLICVLKQVHNSMYRDNVHKHHNYMYSYIYIYPSNTPIGQVWHSQTCIHVCIFIDTSTQITCMGDQPYPWAWLAQEQL